VSADPVKGAAQTYAAVLICGNCGRVQITAIPKGVTQVEYAQERNCPDCCCKTMRPKWERW